MLGRVFESDCPTGDFDGSAERFAHFEVIYFYDRAVDAERQFVTHISETLDLVPHVFHIVKDRIIRADGKPLRFQKIERFGVRRKRFALCRLQIENDYVKSACRSNRGIELSERTRRRISRICKKLFSVFFAFSVQTFKSFFRHINFAANDEFRQFFVERKGNGAHGSQIRRHVFARCSVPSCSAEFKNAVDICQTDRKPVYLQFDVITGIRKFFFDSAVKI